MEAGAASGRDAGDPDGPLGAVLGIRLAADRPLRVLSIFCVRLAADGPFTSRLLSESRLEGPDST